MKSYRRILAVVHAQSETHGVLTALRDIASESPLVQALVLRVIPSDRGFDPDGPAATLPGDVAARHSVAAGARLDAELVRLNLAWVQSAVIWRDPDVAVGKTIVEWRPDLVIASRGRAPARLPEGIDLLETSGRSLLKRLGGMFGHPLPGHA